MSRAGTTRGRGMVQRADISQVLTQMRLVQQQLHRPLGGEPRPGAIAPEQLRRPQDSAAAGASPRIGATQEPPGFGELFSQAIEGVNSTQQAADRLRNAYEGGAPGVSLTQVMVAAEKSSVAFDAMVQVRNKLVDAYQEIMNMPV
jgi:flagellar hook-basal body complex protein FliE